MIIGSFFTIAGGLCLFIAALTQGDGKIGLFWPVMFHLLNSIGFAHILPVSLALFSKIAPRQINATVIGLYYLAFFAANKIVGQIGQLYSTLDTPTFWLFHVATAVVGLVAFVLFKVCCRSGWRSRRTDSCRGMTEGRNGPSDTSFHRRYRESKMVACGQGWSGSLGSASPRAGCCT